MEQLYAMAGTLMGVLIGFLLSQHATRKAQERSAIEAFRQLVGQYLDGAVGRPPVAVAHAGLPRRLRTRIDLARILDTHPDSAGRTIISEMENLP